MALKRISVTRILEEKAETVFSVSAGATVGEAVEEMNRHRIGCVMVLDGEGGVAGIFTERDVLTRVVSSGLVAKDTPVSAVMTTEPKRIEADTSVEDAMQMMTQKRVRHLPVFEGGRLVGMVSIGDITRWLLKVNEMEAENLRRYVFGDYPG
jgi:CBS domain-containing protein